MNTKSFLTKYGKIVAIVVAIIIGFALIISAMFMLADYKEEISDRAASEAQYITIQTRDKIKNGLDIFTTRTVAIASEISAFSQNEDFDINQFKEYMFKLENSRNENNDLYDVVYARFYKDGHLYSCVNDEVALDITSDFYKDTRYSYGYVGSLYDEGKTMTLIAFYAPIEDSELADALVLYYTRAKLERFYSSESMNESAEFTTLCMNNGSIISGFERENSVLIDGESVHSGKIGDIVYRSTLDTSAREQLNNMLRLGQDGTIRTNAGNEACIISVGASYDDMRDLAVVEMYKVDELCASGVNFVYTVIAIVVLFVIVAVAIVIYFVLHTIKINKKLYNAETLDEVAGCLNRKGFEEAARKIIDVNVASIFSIVVVQLKHYKYLDETYGKTEIGLLIKYIKLCISKIIRTEETFGYLGEGKYVLLCHSRDREDFKTNLNRISYMVSKYKGRNELNPSLKYGIFEIDRKENLEVSTMIDFANDANESANKITDVQAGIQFNYYNDELRKERIINEDMELRMEGALANGEFQVFYQPKYNLNTNKQDGAEALVRWYDKASGVYNRPALFMALFETNGFIVKLDKYVFTKVCEYISYSLAHGRTVYPVSVNISRVTAIQPDFIEYYTSIKKKYGIADGQIMIEFTESFAYENYEILGDIVAKLHKAGIKCSIDDFGCGYSSYKILKSLPMDEIKLDRFFMEDGFSKKRDDTIFDSIISLAKALNMKVTQEGVETQEGVARLRELGCDVVQGYVYSHPLPVSDYIVFTQHSSEHKI